MNFIPKNFTQYFMLLLVITGSMSTHAQSTQQQLTITISGIEYDNPSFATLRDNLKKNPKVKSVKPGFSDDVATLSFTYPGEAPQLWDELPKTAKQSFKVIEMNGSSISLRQGNTAALSANTNSTATKTTAAAQAAAAKNDCKDCLYFPLCNSDGTMSFHGKVYKKIEYDQDPLYYNCDDVIITKKWENIVEDGDGYRQSNEYLTLVILKTNSPVGTKWQHEFVSSGLLGPITSIYSFEIIEKGKSYDIDGVNYKDVIVVKEIDGMLSRLCYYAKGYGWVATENLGAEELFR